MITRTDRRRFPILFAAIAALALAGAALGLLFSTVEAQEGSAPAKPTGLSATASHDSVTLIWDDPDDDSIDGYVILRRNRKSDAQGVFADLAPDTGSAATTYTYDRVKANTSYTYRIKAINEYGVSERSRWFHIDTLAAPQETVVEGDGQDEQGGDDDPGGRANVSEGGNDLPNNTTTSGRVEVGGSATGTVGTTTDIDWFAVDLEADKRYQIDLEGADTGRGNNTDPFLLGIRSSVDPSVELDNTIDNDGGVGRNSRLIFTPTSTRKHYVVVGGSGSTDTYTLSVIYLGANGASEADTDFPEDNTTTGRVEKDAPQSTGLFSQIEGKPPSSAGVEIIDSRLVGIDFGQITSVIQAPNVTKSPNEGTPAEPRTLVLNLFDDVVYTAIVEHIEPTSSGHALWGKLDGVELGTMTMVVNGKVVVGSVRTPEAVYAIKTVGSGAYVVRQIDESSLPPAGEPLRDTPSPPDGSPPRPPQEGGGPIGPVAPDGSSPLPPAGEPLRDTSSPPDGSPPRSPQEGGNPMGPADLGGTSTPPLSPTTSSIVDDEPQSDGLFSKLDGDPPSSSGVETIDSRLVEVDFEQLDRVLEAPNVTKSPNAGTPPEPRTLVLNLFDDVVFTGIVEHVEPTSSGHALWGRLDGVELGTMAMVVNGSVVVGSVRTPEAAYAIRTVGSGAYVVRQINESSLLPLGEPLRDPKPASSGSSQSVAGPPDDGSEIDVMVVYTPSSKHFEGGRAAVEALIDLFVTETNQAYANSGANQKIRLVLREALEYIEDGNSHLDLDRFTLDSDGHMDQVHELRDLYSADLAHILVARSVNVCGVAQLPSDDEPIDPETFGFGLTVNKCGGLTFAHELGHNMGLRHDRYVVNQPGSAWNFGYVNQAVFEPGAPESAHWRTIMAYRNQCEEVGSYCPTIGYFSNTELTYDGDPMGVPADHPSTGLDGPADAARTLNERREITANIRRSSSSPTPRIGLSLSPYWLAESGGITGVTATLHRPSSADTVVTVSATPADAVSVSANNTLTIPAGQLVSVGDVTITGVDNSRQTGDVATTVSATASNSDSLGVISPEPVALAISDDETTPVVSLSLSPEEIVENGDRTTDRTYVTATMDNRSGAETTLIVSAESPGAAIDNESALIIPAGQTASVGSGVPVYALDDSKLTQAKKSVTVSAVATNPKGVTSPGSVTLTIIDDEAPYFADDSLAYTFTAGVSGSRFLPEAAHGDGTLTYSIAPSPGDGVTFSPGPPMIRVSPTAAAGETSYALTASDADGETDTMTINVTVRSAVCPSNAAVAGYSDPGVVADCEALLVSRDALSGDQSLNWSEHLSMDSWEGIELAAGGRVVGLDMNSEGLTGTIPSELGRLTKLQYLVLVNNQLTGGIPPELGSLTNLESLHLGGNRLTGEIPRELGGLTNLTGLSLSDNQLTGTIPVELGSLSRLEWLFLNDNQLVGTIPVALDSLTNLEELHLSGNRLVGCIPDGFRDVPYNDLWRLGLPFCSEHHCVTGGAVADAANSDLVYDCETLLAARDTLAGTATLNWSANTSITGWNGITLGGTPRRVTGLDVSSLGMTGEIPRELGSLSNLQYLDLSDNQLTGVIPGELGNLSHLEQLNLRDNGLTGVIPGELGGLASLQVLHLSGNHLVGCVPDGLRKVADSDLASLALPSCGEHHCVTGGAVVDLTSTSLVSDCETLLAARDTLAGTSTLNWSTDTSITFWDGVTLGRTPRSVTRLDVSELGLSGMIPNELGDLSNLQRLTLSDNQLTGTIPKELGDLVSLTSLSLWGNQLSGEIPPELGDLSNLQRLTLSDNQLTGTIPKELGDLVSLTSLSLWGNQLSGEIPPELGDLSNLQRLILSDNQLTGTIPTQLGNLSNLTYLSLVRNELRGTIPNTLGDLSDLQELALGGNQLGGIIPTELGKLFKLTGLYLWSNQLTGEVPSELGDLSNLTSLYLSTNELTGILPRSFTNLTSLTRFYFSNNAGLCAPADDTFQTWVRGIEEVEGEICPTIKDFAADRDMLVRLYNATDGVNWTDNSNWLSDLPMRAWRGVTTDVEGRVSGLDLTENQLSGQLPAELGNLDNLEQLDLGGNQLSGSIPSQLGNLSNLTLLHLGGNQLSGSIPAELGSLSNLTGLYLYGNQLSGSIPPELGSLSNLTEMDLPDNQLSGSIPAELGSLSSLTLLQLPDNQLSDSIPPELGSLSNLTGLNLGGNQLSGSIPPELGSLSNLTGLYLNNNQLSGSIPPELGSLSNLTGLRLDGNQLSGSIPAELGRLSNLRRLDLVDNQLSGSIPAELGRLSNLERLFLYGNQLSGSIPAELGSLSNLMVLNLSGNQLSGSIPAELGSLSNLERLILYGNQLSGTIPAELGSLSSLRVLSLSGNQLTGSIPAELGRLSNLTWLGLRDNQLSGSIPPELGSLSNLERLFLDGNELSGSIPAELGSLSNLRGLYLSGNQLSGCIPEGLRDVPQGDLDQLGLPFCGPTTVTVSITATSTRVRIGSPVPVTATFSEPVSGFTIEDISVVNGSAGSLVGSSGDSVYTFDVTPNAIGIVTVEIAHGEASANLSLGIPYDDDRDGRISLPEAIKAVQDYFAGLIPIEQAIRIVQLYFLSLG